MYVSELGQSIMVPVAARTKLPVHHLIYKYTKKGSVIVNGWRSYDDLAQKKGYTHRMINHSFAFLSSYNKKWYTKSIERCLREFKENLQSYEVMKSRRMEKIRVVFNRTFQY